MIKILKLPTDATLKSGAIYETARTQSWVRLVIYKVNHGRKFPGIMPLQIVYVMQVEAVLGLVFSRTNLSNRFTKPLQMFTMAHPDVLYCASTKYGNMRHVLPSMDGSFQCDGSPPLFRMSTQRERETLGGDMMYRPRDQHSST